MASDGGGSHGTKSTEFRYEDATRHAIINDTHAHNTKREGRRHKDAQLQHSAAHFCMQHAHEHIEASPPPNNTADIPIFQHVRNQIDVVVVAARHYTSPGIRLATLHKSSLGVWCGGVRVCACTCRSAFGPHRQGRGTWRARES